MLDGLIALLETIVAMEELSDIDIEGDGIDIGNILSVNWDSEGNPVDDAEFTEGYNRWRQSIIEQITEYNEDGSKNAKFNKDLADAMGKIKLDGHILSDIISWDANDLANMGKEFNESYAKLMDAMVKAAVSGDYDLDNIAESVQ